MTEVVELSGLTATGGIGQILLAWDNPEDPNESGLPYLQLDAIEIWASVDNDRDHATLIGAQPKSTSFIHDDVESGAGFYYWIRPRLKPRRTGYEPRYGDWHPFDEEDGVFGQEGTTISQGGESGYFQIGGGLVLQWGTAETNSSGYVTIAFPVPFETICIHLAARRTDINIDYELIAGAEAPIASFQAASYELQPSEAGTTYVQTDAPITWFAIGY